MILYKKRQLGGMLKSTNTASPARAGMQTAILSVVGSLGQEALKFGFDKLGKTDDVTDPSKTDTVTGTGSDLKTQADLLPSVTQFNTGFNLPNDMKLPSLNKFDVSNVAGYRFNPAPSSTPWFGSNPTINFKKGGKADIHIKKSKRGSFTKWCKSQGFDGVTEECIRKGKASKDPRIRKKANFAANARKWN